MECSWANDYALCHKSRTLLTASQKDIIFLHFDIEKYSFGIWKHKSIYNRCIGRKTKLRQTQDQWINSKQMKYFLDSLQNTVIFFAANYNLLLILKKYENCKKKSSQQPSSFFRPSPKNFHKYKNGIKTTWKKWINLFSIRISRRVK